MIRRWWFTWLRSYFPFRFVHVGTILNNSAYFHLPFTNTSRQVGLLYEPETTGCAKKLPHLAMIFRISFSSLWTFTKLTHTSHLSIATSESPFSNFSCANKYWYNNINIYQYNIYINIILLYILKVTVQLIWIKIIFWFKEFGFHHFWMRALDYVRKSDTYKGKRMYKEIAGVLLSCIL